jgi:hypothetical protein
VLGFTLLCPAPPPSLFLCRYQTNLMALAAGGHSTRDFLKFGTPMQIVLAVVSILVLSVDWKIVWLVTGVAGSVILGAPQAMEVFQVLRGRRENRDRSHGPID